MYRVSKCAPQEALWNLDAAFQHFFRRCALKKQGKWTGQARLPAVQDQEERTGQFPAHRLHRRVGDGDRVAPSGAAAAQRTGVSADRWSEDPLGHGERAGGALVCVLQVEEEQAVPENTGPVVGIDLGIKPGDSLGWDGDSQSSSSQTASQEAQAVTAGGKRRKKGSHNRKKAVRKLAKLHRQITNQRHNTLHQVTTRLARTKSVLVIEDLNVSGMLKNHRLAQAIGDVGFAEFKRQLLYKASWYGARVILADRWEPSSKRCSSCGWVDADLTLSDRIYHCEQCGLVLDRDLNAAINLMQLAGSSPDSGKRLWSRQRWHEAQTSCETGGREAGT